MLTHGQVSDIIQCEAKLSRLIKYHDEDHAPQMLGRLQKLHAQELHEVLLTLNKLSRVVKSIRDQPIAAEL